MERSFNLSTKFELTVCNLYCFFTTTAVLLLGIRIADSMAGADPRLYKAGGGEKREENHRPPTFTCCRNSQS